MTERLSASDRPVPWGRPWALLFSRLLLGLIFLMAGSWKVFSLGPLEHARRLFVEPYRDSFLPNWSLWATGAAIPVVELVAGAAVLIGLWRRSAYLALGGVLTIVTFGHLVAEPLYAFHTHVIPRWLLLTVLLLHSLKDDQWSVDEWWATRNAPDDGATPLPTSQA